MSENHSGPDLGLLAGTSAIHEEVAVEPQRMVRFRNAALLASDVLPVQSGNHDSAFVQVSKDDVGSTETTSVAPHTSVASQSPADDAGSAQGIALSVAARHESQSPTQSILTDAIAIETQSADARIIDPALHGSVTGTEADAATPPGHPTIASSPHHVTEGLAENRPVIVEHAHAPVSSTDGDLQTSAHAAELQIGPSIPAWATVPADQPTHASVAPAAAPTDASAAPAMSASASVSLTHLQNPASDSSEGATTSAAIGPQGATAAQVQQALGEGALNVNGAGIKVGVLSDSFNDLGGAAADEADGALPSASNIQVLSDLSSGGTDEGRAMMQIVHDTAPGAGLAVYTSDNSEQAFANGILALAAAGCKVICDDVSYFDEPFFQNGIVAQAIQTVEAEGVTYVTSAGNNASNAYQAAWTQASGSFDGFSFSDAENFGGSIVQTVTINTEGLVSAVPLVLQWNQAYGAATSDLHLVVFKNGSLYGDFNNQNYSWEL